jgi:hypothetical protein
MAHLSTVRLLVAWANWGQGQSIDYPSMSPMFGERALKTPLHGSGHIPDDVAEVEAAVCLLEWFYRSALIYRYQRRLSFEAIAVKFGSKDYRYGRKIVTQAEDLVEKRLRDVGESFIKHHAQELSPAPP